MVIGESSIHDVFSIYKLCLVMINKLKIELSPFCCVKFFSLEQQTDEYHS